MHPNKKTSFITKGNFAILAVIFLSAGLIACVDKDIYYYGDSTVTDPVKNDPSHTLILKTPETGESPFPVIVFIHGGKWGEPSFQKSYFDNGVDYAVKNGFAGVSINYHLTSYEISEADSRPWPDQLNDAKMAVRWLRKNAAKFNIDPSNIYVLGHSSGGQIALMMALTNSSLTNQYYGKYDRESDIQGVCSVAPPTHLLSMYIERSLPDPEKIFNALIDINPVISSRSCQCRTQDCLYRFEGKCIDIDWYCESDMLHEDIAAQDMSLAKASPLQNLMKLQKKPDGTTGHVPVLMVNGDDDMVYPEYHHRPFFNRLDPKARAEMHVGCGHYFSTCWNGPESYIYNEAMEFFMSIIAGGYSG